MSWYILVWGVRNGKGALKKLSFFFFVNSCEDWTATIPTQTRMEAEMAVLECKQRQAGFGWALGAVPCGSSAALRENCSHTSLEDHRAELRVARSQQEGVKGQLHVLWVNFPPISG